jgi:hypothetical protein
LFLSFLFETIFRTNAFFPKSFLILSQQGHWSFRYYEERVTEEEVSPRAGQRPGKLVF